MKTDASKFVVPGGLAYPQAEILAAEIDAAEPNADQLVSGFFADFMALELTAQIRSGQVNEDRLRELLLAPELVSAIAAAIRAKHDDGLLRNNPSDEEPSHV